MSPRRRSLIVGGQPVKENNDNKDWPTYAAAFAWTGIDAYAGWGCGGSLVHSDMVLTAAHCQWVSHAGVWIGAHHRNGSSGGTFYGTQQLWIHPNYTDQQLVHHDVMLIQLNDTVQNVEEYYQYNMDANLPMDGDSVRVVGFGTTAENGNLSWSLREVDVSYVDDETCRATWPLLQPSLHLCAGTVQGGKDACDSDSGSPLFVVDSQDDNNKDKIIMQVGIVGEGLGCGRAGLPALYSRISTDADWIRDTICQQSRDPPMSCFDQGGSGPGRTASLFRATTTTRTMHFAAPLFWVGIMGVAAMLMVSLGRHLFSHRRRQEYQQISNTSIVV